MRRSWVLSAIGAGALAVLLRTGCASKEKEFETIDKMQGLVRTSVADSERADKVVLLLEELKSSFKGLRKGIKAERKRLYELNANYDAKRSDFDSIYEAFGKRRDEHMNNVLALRASARELMTADEWKTLYEDLQQAEDS